MPGCQNYSPRRVHEQGGPHILAVQKADAVKADDQPELSQSFCTGLDLLAEGSSTAMGRCAEMLQVWYHSGCISCLNQLDIVQLEPRR